LGRYLRAQHNLVLQAFSLEVDAQGHVTVWPQAEQGAAGEQEHVNGSDDIKGGGPQVRAKYHETCSITM
jgi:hypothetical protein